jgi:hypothetical protein
MILKQCLSVDENLDGITDYSFNPDFNFRQLVELVVRWEYLPGSALYLSVAGKQVQCQWNVLFGTT